MSERRAETTRLLPRTELVRHPASVGGDRLKLTTTCSIIGEGVFEVIFNVSGDIDQIKLPPPSQGQRRHELWRTTCFEFFARNSSERGYTEVNVAPSSAWAAYSFEGYRAGGRADLAANVDEFSFRRSDNTLIVSAVIALPAFKLVAASTLRFEPTAVIEDQTGGLSYWARAHQASKPDFHIAIAS